MNLDEFTDQIVALSSRVNALLKRKEELESPQSELQEESFEELYIALEEAEVALEELRQQQDELVVARSVAERNAARYQELFEEAPDAYIVTDEQGTIQEANRAAVSLFQINERHLVGKPLNLFLTQEAWQDFFLKLAQLKQFKQVQDWQVRLKPRGGSLIDVALRVAVVQSKKEGPISLRWLLRDITALKQIEVEKAALENEMIIQERVKERLLHRTFHDALTKLPNRALFMNRLKQAIEYGKRHKDYLYAVLFLDLDRFKVINDSLGHIFGDQLLIAVAERLASVVRPTDTVARLGGDEFTILLLGIEDITDAVKVTNRIQESLRLPLVLDTQEVFTTASIGIAFSETGYNQPSEILRDADIAMYRAKSQEPGRYKVFNKFMHV